MQQFQNDFPIVSKDADEFNIAPFAQNIAQGILNYPSQKSLTIGIYGKWGQGKTSTINLIEQELRESQKIKTLVFNPWCFSGKDYLAKSFFKELQSVFTNEAQIRKTIASLAKITLPSFSFLAAYLSGVPVPSWATTNRCAQKISNWVDPKLTVTEQKQKVSSLLEAENIKLVVFIDDLDRLYPQEIIDVFALIKSTLDFDNTVFVVAFDFDIVCKVLKKEYDYDDDYLEKIIQVPFNIPKNDKKVLGSIFDNYYNKLKHHERVNVIERDKILTNILDLMSTKRDLIRYFNTVTFTYSAVYGNVNILDFLAIEALRVFSPNIHEALYEKHVQVGYSTTKLSRITSEDGDEMSDTEFNALKSKADKTSIFSHMEAMVAKTSLNSLHKESLTSILKFLYLQNQRQDSILYDESFPYYFRAK